MKRCKREGERNLQNGTENVYMKTAGSHITVPRAVTSAEKRIGVWGGRYGPGAATAVSEACPFFLRAFLPLPLSFFPSFIQSLVHSYSLSLSLSVCLSVSFSFSLYLSLSLSLSSPISSSTSSLFLYFSLSRYITLLLFLTLANIVLPSTTQFSTHVSRFQPPPTPPAQSA